MAFGKKRSSSKGSSSFKYQERDAEAYAARQNVGGMREGFLVDGVKMFSPKEGDHSVRILPPAWTGARHYGIDAYVHYDIGPDGGAYLCLDQMRASLEKAKVSGTEVPEGECAICAARKQALADGEDEDLIRALGWTRRVLCYVIDRDNESEGPELWSMPQTLDKEIAAQCTNKKTGEVYALDHPDKGYDVSFERIGSKQKTKYSGIQLDRNSSPLSDDDGTATEWLEFIKENKIPELLLFQEADYIENLVSGGARAAARRAKPSDDDDDSKGKRRRKPAAEEEEEEPVSRRPKFGKKKANGRDDVNLSWADVHGLDEDELTALAEEHEIDLEDVADEEEAADKICSELGIKAPAKKKKVAEEEEEEEEEEGEEEEEKPAKKKTAAVRRKDDEEEEDGGGRLAKLRKKMSARNA